MKKLAPQTNAAESKWILLPAVLSLLVWNSAIALELTDVLERTSIKAPARVNFNEERYSELFSEPLKLTGYLEYLEDGQLHKTIETPFQEAYFVHADRIEIVRGDEREVLSLRRSRHLRTMLGGIEAILAGKLEQLEKSFSYTLNGTENDWSLELTPKSRRIAKKLIGLVVAGDDNQITSIRVNLQGDEWHLMEISHPGNDE